MQIVLSGARPPYDDDQDRMDEGGESPYTQTSASGEQQQHAPSETNSTMPTDEHMPVQDQEMTDVANTTNNSQPENDDKPACDEIAKDELDYEETEIGDDDATSMASSLFSDQGPSSELGIRFESIKDRIDKFHRLDSSLRFVESL